MKITQNNFHFMHVRNKKRACHAGLMTISSTLLEGSGSLIMAPTAAKGKPLNPYFFMEMGKK